MKIYYLYIHINKTNNKVYIGWTSNPKKRWRNGLGYDRNEHFRSSIQKYGWTGFYHIIILSSNNLNYIKDLEKKYISLYNSDNPLFGYNMTKGGEGKFQNKNSYTPEYHHKYYQDNKDTINARMKKYVNDNREKKNEWSREYYRKHRDKILAQQNEYYQRKKQEKQQTNTPC